MPAVFQKLGISFTYPENWTLDETEALEGNRSVAVYSPGGSFWSVSVHPPGTNPRSLVEAAVTALRESYDELDAESVTETLDGCKLVGSDVNFYYLDLTNTAVVRSFKSPAGVCLILCQADDREFDAIEAVMRAMTLSLIRGFSGPSTLLATHDDVNDESPPAP